MTDEAKSISELSIQTFDWEPAPTFEPELQPPLTSGRSWPCGGRVGTAIGDGAIGAKLTDPWWAWAIELNAEGASWDDAGAAKAH